MSRYESIEELQFLSHLYQDPYSSCDLYVKEDQKLRVFLIEEEALRKALLPILMQEQITMGFLGEVLCIVVPYAEGQRLFSWMQEDHTMLERILLCKEILFHVISSKESEAFQRLYLDGGNIEIQDNTILYFQHPNFSRLLHEKEYTAIPQQCAQLFYDILKEDASVNRRSFLKNPKKLQEFHHSILWKRYHDFDPLMRDLNGLYQTYQALQKKRIDLYRYIMLAAALCFTLLLLLFAYLKYQDQHTQRYDGATKIGTEDLRS